MSGKDLADFLFEFVVQTFGFLGWGLLYLQLRLFDVVGYYLLGLLDLLADCHGRLGYLLAGLGVYLFAAGLGEEFELVDYGQLGRLHGATDKLAP